MSLSTTTAATRPSLTLDFARLKKLDPRITFTRASTATYYDGKTTTKAEENLYYASQDFTNATWNIGGTINSRTETAPDGSSTALNVSFTQQFQGVYKTDPNCYSGKTYTLSFWAKRDTGTNPLYVYSNYGNNVGNYSPTSTWARYSFTFTLSPAATYVVFIAQERGTTNFGNVYLWGVQLEERSFLTGYTPTTTLPITNYIPVLQTASSNQPRFDHDPVTGESLGLVIEEARTNLVTYSSDFSNAAWANTNATVLSNEIISPDGSLTADKLIPTSSVSVTHATQRGPITVTNSTSYTWSVYAKAGEYNWLGLNAYTGLTYRTSWFNLSTGVIGTEASGNSSTITNVGNGWYRLTVTRTTADTTAYLIILVANADNAPSFAGNGYSGIYIWGAQLEAGGFATSYIPTTTATVTRNTDNTIITGINFTSWFNYNSGTFYAEATSAGGTGPRVIGTDSDGGILSLGYGIGGVTSNHFISGEINLDKNGNKSNTSFNIKSACSYDRTGTSITREGLAPATSVNNGITETKISYISLGRQGNGGSVLNGSIKKIAYYPVRLSDSELRKITAMRI